MKFVSIKASKRDIVARRLPLLIGYSEQLVERADTAKWSRQLRNG